MHNPGMHNPVQETDLSSIWKHLETLYIFESVLIWYGYEHTYIIQIVTYPSLES